MEASLVLPILLMLTFGIWSTARAWNINNTMEHAAREAARYGATIDPWDISTSPSQVIAVSDSDLSNSAVSTSAVIDCVEIIADTATSTCKPTHVNNTGTQQVLVKLTYPNYSLNFLFFSVNITMEAVAISRFES